MKSAPRLSSNERRQAIVEAVRTVFAEKGFEGTTTRNLAAAAGVSEALLYKHFPSKQSLYAAMLDACAEGPAFAEFNRILALEPSASTLVVMAYFTVSYYVRGREGDCNRRPMNCLLVRSLLGDGEFVRLTHKKFARAWIKKFESCMKAASAAGELQPLPLRSDLGFWFVHHIAFSLMLHLHPQEPAINYRASTDVLVEQATWFALRGLGLREDVIRRDYNPKALLLLGN
jgi:AcrR family transcriptional regulator